MDLNKKLLDILDYDSPVCNGLGRDAPQCYDDADCLQCQLNQVLEVFREYLQWSEEGLKKLP